MLHFKRTVFLWFPILSKLISWQEVEEKEKNQSKIEKKNIRPEARKIDPKSKPGRLQIPII